MLSRGLPFVPAIREDQAAARSVGVPATRYKQLAIAISAALTAMAGTFYAQYVLFIDPPSVLPLSLSIQICLVVVLGGAGTLVGPLLGAAVLVPLSAATSVALGGSGRSLDLVVYGFLIMLIARYGKHPQPYPDRAALEHARGIAWHAAHPKAAMPKLGEGD